MENPLKYIPSPDPRTVRAKMKGKASAGEVFNSGCPHPTSAIMQYIDDMGDVHRAGRPTNLFECSLCHSLLRLVDFNGIEATDG